MAVEQVRELLQRFQDGYDTRDLSRLDAFMELFVLDEDLEVIGTGAVEPGKGEWCQGVLATRELIGSDWEHWGDLVLDLAGVHIQVQGDVAWLATSGTVTDTIPMEDRHSGYLEFVQEVLRDEDMDSHEKTLEIVRLGNDVVADLSLPATYVWPLRFTAVAVRRKGQWRFQQMQFSFPTTRVPDMRYA